MSKIEWTDRTWNPVTGCVKVSEGCRHCYAETMSLRLQKMGLDKYSEGFAPRRHPDRLDEPSRWRKPSLIFVCSMSDLFQSGIPDPFLDSVFHAMVRADWHTYQILTKRPKAMRHYFRKKDEWYVRESFPMPQNLWVGASVENQKALEERAEFLLETPGIALKRFLSVEPMLGPAEGIPEGIDWVICGGESGPKARPMDPGWVRALRDECLDKNIPFFFKQWGGRNKKKAGRLLDGREWNGMPERWRLEPSFRRSG